MWRMSNAQATDLAATFTLSKSCRLLFYDADLDGLRAATKPPAPLLGNHPDPVDGVVMAQPTKAKARARPGWIA
jgi:hypothetical protein